MKLEEIRECTYKGTKVEIVKNSLGSINNVGDVGVITELDESDKTIRVFVNEDGDCGNWHYFTDIIPLDKKYTKEQCEKKIKKWVERFNEIHRPTTYGQIKPLVIEWAKEKNLTDSDAQYVKVYEEIGELAKAMLEDDLNEIKDAIGDIAVTLIIHSQQTGVVYDEGVYLVTRNFSGKQTFKLFVKNLNKVEYRNISLSWLNEIAHSYNTNIDECLTIAWNTIKDRKGKTINGTFIKE